MAIRFRCPHCKRAMQVQAQFAGRTIPCPACKGKLVIPAQSQDVGSTIIDWNMMEQASHPERARGARPEDPNGGHPDEIDWNSVTKPLFDLKGKAEPDESGAAGPTAAAERGSQSGLYTPDAETMRSFVSDAGRAVIVGITHPGSFLVLVILHVLACILALSIGWLALLLRIEQPGVGSFVVLIAALALPHVILVGHLAPFFMEITNATSKGDDRFPLPKFSIMRAGQAWAQLLPFLLVYVTPIVTLPLAPLGWCGLSRTHDSRALNMLWAWKSATRHAPQVFVVTMGIVLLVVLDVWLGAFIHSHAQQGLVTLTAAADGMSRSAAEIAVTIAVLGPLLLLEAMAVARLAGLFGRYDKDVYTFMPRESDMAVTIGTLLMTVLLSVFAIPGALYLLIYGVLEPLK